MCDQDFFLLPEVLVAPFESSGPPPLAAPLESSGPPPFGVFFEDPAPPFLLVEDSRLFFDLVDVVIGELLR